MPIPSFASVAHIRQTFLDFFRNKGHTVVESSPLVPLNDPTLMFTNSGMVQFKDVFLGTDKRAYVRAASVQACLRAGGKHNDLENVGYTARHHTFFEMLGNWSFGDYFKRDSLVWGWELLTKVYGIPAERLMATVYHEDDEAYDIWTRVIGLPPEKVVRIGDNKGKRYASDNFWMMADTGPCGPCSEIFYDHGPSIPGGPPGSADEDGDRFIEIWNHVFMQFDMHADGTLSRLPAPCVDTGMGLERLAAILQKVHSNYEIDLFDTLIRAAGRETGCVDLKSPSLRVIADHIRACSFLIADGVTPSNEGRGYVQRRIIRRAIRHGYKLGKKEPFFYRLVPDLVNLMGQAYPRLETHADRIAEALRMEEVRFYETLETGMGILDAATAGQTQTLAGEVAFKLHDTYGFPLDLTQDVCRERGIKVDSAGFDEAMKIQKEQARASGRFKMEKTLDYQGQKNAFVGYERQEQQSKVLALFLDGKQVSRLDQGQTGVAVLDVTPFYAESGGQVGDQGSLVNDRNNFRVEDTQKIKSGGYAHHGTVERGFIALGDDLHATVDKSRRAAVARNHSATHLLHKALRTVLGEHVQQKGSLVTPDRTRFDFSHHAPLSVEEMEAIERLVNMEILANSPVSERHISMEDARKTGAMMLFGEKYGDVVRVMDIGSTTELCGGTHVEATGDIGFFKILTEGGVASGVRRVEAVTGQGALKYIQSTWATIQTSAEALKTSIQEMPAKIVAMQEALRTMEKEVVQLRSRQAAAQARQLLECAKTAGGMRVLVATLDGMDTQTLRETTQALRDALGHGVVVLSSVIQNKVQVVAGVAGKAMTRCKAAEVVNHVASMVGGKGGGKPDLAMAGGTDAAALPKAMASAEAWLLQIFAD